MELAVGFILYKENSAQYLAEFLPSLRAALKFLPTSEYRIYAFDNSPLNDKSNELIIDRFNRENSALGLKIEYQRAADGINQGFGRAYNRLIEQAVRDGACYFFMINPDTVLDAATILELVKAMEVEKVRKDSPSDCPDSQELAVAVPKIRRWDFFARCRTEMIDSCGLIQKIGLRFKDLGQGEKDEGQYDHLAPGKIISASGAAGLFRLSALEKIKEKGQYFDERFFMYREDCDLALRLNRIGGVARLVSTALIYHDRTAASSGRGLFRALQDRFKKSRQVRSWSHLSELLIYVKHWKSQNLVSQSVIIIRILFIFIFSLILEQFNLKNYSLAYRIFKDSWGID